MTRIELTDEERAKLEAIKRAFALAFTINESPASPATEPTEINR